MNAVLGRCTVVFLFEFESRWESWRTALVDAGIDARWQKPGSLHRTLSDAGSAAIWVVNAQESSEDGEKSVGQIREYVAHRRSAVLVLLSEEDEAVKARFKKAGATGWLSDGLSAQGIVALVREAQRRYILAAQRTRRPSKKPGL